MKHITRLGMLVGVLALTQGYGLGFGSMGQVSSSMGGAGVALKNSAWGIYYNPALLGADRRAKVGYSFGAQFREQNLLQLATIDFEELSQITTTLDEKLLGGASVAGGAITIPGSTGGGNGNVTIDGALGDALGKLFGVGADGTIGEENIKNLAQDIGIACNGSGTTKCDSLSSLGGSLKGNTTAQNKLKDKLVNAAEAAGAPPLLTGIFRDIDVSNIGKIIEEVGKGDFNMEKFLASAGRITIPRGADSDIDKLLDAFDTLNNTLQGNDFSLNSQNGIVIQFRGKERTKKVEADGIGEVTVQEADSGRGAVAVAVLQPGAVSPLVAVDGVELAGGAGAGLRVERVGVRLGHYLAILTVDRIFIRIITLQAGDEPLPNAALHFFQGGGIFIPSVKITEDADLLGVGRPDPEGVAALAVYLVGVSSKTTPCVTAAPLRKGFQF